MHKEELLNELSIHLSAGTIRREDITRLISHDATPHTKRFPHFSVTKMLYVLGAAIAVIGIIIFVAQIWNDIASFGRITVTLGLGLLIAAFGSVLLKQKPKDAIGAIFHFIGGMLIPGGAVVALSEMHVASTSLWPLAITFGAIFIFYVLLNTVHKHPILTFFTIANGTAFLYLLVETIIAGPSYRHKNVYAYLTMAISASYLLLAHTFRAGWNKNLIGALYFFGSTGFLGAAFSQVFHSVPWQMLYVLIILCGLVLSVYVKSRIILVMSTLFLIAHISYITEKYFAHSLGWPISLVILGFVFIVLGYASLAVNKKYITAGS